MQCCLCVLEWYSHRWDSVDAGAASACASTAEEHRQLLKQCRVPD